MGQAEVDIRVVILYRAVMFLAHGRATLRVWVCECQLVLKTREEGQRNNTHTKQHHTQLPSQHTRTHRHTQAHTHTRTRAHAHVYTRTHIHTPTHPRTQLTCTRTAAQNNTYTKHANTTNTTENITEKTSTSCTRRPSLGAQEGHQL